MEQTAPSAIAFPALLRHARTTYGSAMRRALVAVGCDDIPANGLYVIGALALGDYPIGRIVRDLRVSKQAAGQLVDTLVLRGYLERTVDADDRRRLTLGLTERGRMAAAAQAMGRMGVDEELAARVGADCVEQARKALETLIDMGAED